MSGKFFILAFTLVFLLNPMNVTFAQDNVSPSILEPMDLDAKALGLDENDERVQAALQRHKEQRIESQKTQTEINKIVLAFQNKQISQEEARKQLHPFVKKTAPSYSPESVDMQIKMLENQIDYLKKVKNDPDYVVDRTIDTLLGISKNAFQIP